MKPVMKLKPSSKGLIIRDPVTKSPLPEAGAIMPVSGVEGRFWRRRLNDGTVIEVKEEIKTEKIESNNTGGFTQKKKKFTFGGNKE